MPNSQKRVLVLNGHPDASPERLSAGIASAYAEGATAGGHQVERLDIGTLDFPLIRSARDYHGSPVPPDIRAAQLTVQGAEHVVVVFPIWFGGPPALLKAFFEQLLRKGFALSSPQAALMSLLAGKSVRVIVTMGAPLPIFRLVLGGHGVASFVKGLLWATGAGPVRQTLFGRAHVEDPARKARWLAEVRALGARAV